MLQSARPVGATRLGKGATTYSALRLVVAEGGILSVCGVAVHCVSPRVVLDCLANCLTSRQGSWS